MNKKIFAKIGLCLILAICASGCGAKRALLQGVPKQVIGAAQLFCDGEPQPTIDSEYYVPAIANRTNTAREKGRQFPMRVCKQMKYRESQDYDFLPSASSYKAHTRATYIFDVVGLDGNVWGELSLVWEKNNQKVIAFSARVKPGRNCAYESGAYGDYDSFHYDVFWYDHKAYHVESQPWTARVGDVY